MGLGKTIQTISFLYTLVKEVREGGREGREGGREGGMEGGTVVNKRRKRRERERERERGELLMEQMYNKQRS